MWKKIIVAQICICVFLASGYIAIEKSGSESMMEKRGKIVAAMSKHYTVHDIFNAGKEAAAEYISVFYYDLIEE